MTEKPVMDSVLENNCSDLVPHERSGHTAALEENLLYVWGGYRSVAGANVSLPNDEIWVYDLEQGVWKLFNMTGEVPPKMSGSCGCSLNRHMYIFGGCDNMGQTDEMYCVSLTDGKNTWRKIKNAIGSAPSPREKLSCWVHKGRIIYFGGYGEKPPEEFSSSNENFILDDASWVEVIIWGWNNELHIFDPMHATWSEPQIHGRPPGPRAAHASAMLGCRGYICGGIVKETRMSDIHCLDLESWTWSQIIPVSTTPESRSWHTLTAVSDSSLFLFGGLSVDRKPMSDGWLFDAETKKWREVEHPFKDKPRLWHTACVGKDSDVIVFGGSCDYILDNLTGHCNDVLISQMQPYPLFRICEDYIAKNVKNHEVLMNQLPLLPSRLLAPIQRKMSFYRPSTKQSS
ncbi:kelch domain-containing protein 1-like [Chelmon rostratus]|uniref:kelch domain-containing protein 1-like n=1 Tax=Chelmon rostratus TaxID=109905 RepID=UPI001BED3ABE|nr:kelch domain-containing protein 1-like [Chelmon rostratus]